MQGLTSGVKYARPYRTFALIQYKIISNEHRKFSTNGIITRIITNVDCLVVAIDATEHGCGVNKILRISQISISRTALGPRS
jgi:hypothetical protein